ncbi:MAG: putative hydrolase, partial [Burkholderiales bacterium]|nr:putative hydrolase [Burkholderiales bacterium]
MPRLLALALLLSTLSATAFSADAARYIVISGGVNVGHVFVETKSNVTTIDYDVKDNGRGPTMAEKLTIGPDGLPTTWSISGTSTFGSKVNESFERNNRRARWLDSVGKGQATLNEPVVYVAQQGSPWSLQIYARALLKQPALTMRALPAGRLKLEKGESLGVEGKGGALQVTRYDLSGIDTEPDTMLLDAEGELFAVVTPDVVVVREGYEGEEVRLRKLAADWATQRYATLQRDIAHRYGGPVRIRNVRVFDPKTSALTPPVSVVVSGRQIAAVETLDSPATPGETTIDGAGGTVIAGLYEMHGHLGQEEALMNVLAGVTTVRDMGSDNAVLDSLVRRIDSGEIAGPNVIRSGFIEGKSPFSANNGFVVDSQEKALEA